MPIVSQNILKDYGIKRLSTNQWGKKGEYYISNDTKIDIICDRCGKKYKLRYATIKKQGDKVFCIGCASGNKKEELYKNRFYNNRDKAKESNLKKYGMEGTPRKGINIGSKKSDKTKKLLSEKAINRFKDKSNHPRYGKKMSLKSKKKMIESNSKTWCNKVLKGYLKTNKCYKSGHYYSKKNDRKIYYRSSYEFIYYTLLENCNSVLHYDVEPFYIPYISIDGNLHRYIPDVLVYWKSCKKSLVEIKPKRLISDKINKLKFKESREYIKEHNIDEFVILSFGDFWKHILINLDETMINFNNDFLFKILRGITNEK